MKSLAHPPFSHPGKSLIVNMNVLTMVNSSIDDLTDGMVARSTSRPLSSFTMADQREVRI